MIEEDPELLKAIIEQRVVLKNKNFPRRDEELANFLNKHFLSHKVSKSYGDVKFYSVRKPYNSEKYVWTTSFVLSNFPSAIVMTLDEARSFFKTKDSFPIY